MIGSCFKPLFSKTGLIRARFPFHNRFFSDDIKQELWNWVPPRQDSSRVDDQLIPVIEKKLLTVQEIHTALYSQGAENIVCLELNKGTMDTIEHMVIASGRTSRHIHKMAESIHDAILARKLTQVPSYKLGIEGEKNDDWYVIDCYNLMVHIMLPKTRQYYDLESHWTAKSRPYLVYHDDDRRVDKQYEVLMDRFPVPLNEEELKDRLKGPGGRHAGAVGLLSSPEFRHLEHLRERERQRKEQGLGPTLLPPTTPPTALLETDIMSGEGGIGVGGVRRERRLSGEVNVGLLNRLQSGPESSSSRRGRRGRESSSNVPSFSSFLSTTAPSTSTSTNTSEISPSSTSTNKNLTSHHARLTTIPDPSSYDSFSLINKDSIESSLTLSSSSSSLSIEESSSTSSSLSQATPPLPLFGSEGVFGKLPKKNPGFTDDFDPTIRTDSSLSSNSSSSSQQYYSSIPTSPSIPFQAQKLQDLKNKIEEDRNETKEINSSEENDKEEREERENLIGGLRRTMGRTRSTRKPTPNKRS